MSKYEETTSNGPIKYQTNDGRKSISPITNNDIVKDMAGHTDKKVRMMHTPDGFNVLPV